MKQNLNFNTSNLTFKVEFAIRSISSRSLFYISDLSPTKKGISNEIPFFISTTVGYTFISSLNIINSHDFIRIVKN